MNINVRLKSYGPDTPQVCALNSVMQAIFRQVNFAKCMDENVDRLRKLKNAPAHAKLIETYDISKRVDPSTDFIQFSEYLRNHISGAREDAWDDPMAYFICLIQLLHLEDPYGVLSEVFRAIVCTDEFVYIEGEEQVRLYKHAHNYEYFIFRRNLDAVPDIPMGNTMGEGVDEVIRKVMWDPEVDPTPEPYQRDGLFEFVQAPPVLVMFCSVAEKDPPKRSIERWRRLVKNRRFDLNKARPLNYPSHQKVYELTGACVYRTGHYVYIAITDETQFYEYDNARQHPSNKGLRKNRDLNPGERPQLLFFNRITDRCPQTTEAYNTTLNDYILNRGVI